jgi:hypothetical protein
VYDAADHGIHVDGPCQDTRPRYRGMSGRRGFGPFVRLLDGAMTEVGTRTSMRMCLRPAPSRSQLGGRGTSLAGARLGYLVSGVAFRIAESTSRIA